MLLINLYCTDIYNLKNKTKNIKLSHMKRLHKENHKEDIFFDNSNNLNVSLSVIYKIFLGLMVILAIFSLVILLLPISYFLRYLMCYFSDNRLYNLFITHGNKYNIFDINSDTLRLR